MEETGGKQLKRRSQETPPAVCNSPKTPQETLKCSVICLPSDYRGRADADASRSATRPEETTVCRALVRRDKKPQRCFLICVVFRPPPIDVWPDDLFASRALCCPGLCLFIAFVCGRAPPAPPRNRAINTWCTGKRERLVKGNKNVGLSLRAAADARRTVGGSFVELFF